MPATFPAVSGESENLNQIPNQDKGRYQNQKNHYQIQRCQIQKMLLIQSR